MGGFHISLGGGRPRNRAADSFCGCCFFGIVLCVIGFFTSVYGAFFNDRPEEVMAFNNQVKKFEDTYKEELMNATITVDGPTVTGIVPSADTSKDTTYDHDRNPEELLPYKPFRLRAEGVLDAQAFSAGYNNPQLVTVTDRGRTSTVDVHAFQRKVETGLDVCSAATTGSGDNRRQRSESERKQECEGKCTGRSGEWTEGTNTCEIDYRGTEGCLKLKPDGSGRFATHTENGGFGCGSLLLDNAPDARWDVLYDHATVSNEGTVQPLNTVDLLLRHWKDPFVLFAEVNFTYGLSPLQNFLLGVMLMVFGGLCVCVGCLVCVLKVLMFCSFINGSSPGEGNFGKFMQTFVIGPQ